MSTRVARLGNAAAMFGDFEVRHLARAKLGLFHLGANRFNGFRAGPHYTALDEGDMPKIGAHLPADLAMPLGMAEEA